MAKKRVSNEVRTIEIVGEIIRFGDNFPTPAVFTNEDDTETHVLFLDVRADGLIYKVNLRGDRTLGAFADGEFYHPIEEEWFSYPTFKLGDFVKITGSYIQKPPTDKFDRIQHVLIVWEPWNIRQCKAVARPAKKKMKAW